jgi:hypothetical protein
MSQKIALLMSGNIRTFLYNNNNIANKYLELANSQDMDIFIYTDNNDFYYNDCQYFSENNREKVLGIESNTEKRFYKNIDFISYDEASKIIKKSLTEIFGDRLKKIYIDNFNPNKIDTIYDKSNEYHTTFMNNPYSNSNRKQALIGQQYKLYECYNLTQEYEKENNIQYDIIIKSRFDVILTDLNKINIRSLNFENNLYSYKYEHYISDVWAVGDRFIMSKYCNYYNYISCNIFNNSYSPDGENIKNIDSDSCEYGLTYLIKNIHKYNFYHMDVNEISYKFYN